MVACDVTWTPSIGRSNKKVPSTFTVANQDNMYLLFYPFME